MRRFPRTHHGSILSGAAATAILSFASNVHAADEFMSKAQAVVAAAVKPSPAWDGPTAGPKAEPSKTVIYVASDLRNGGVLGVSDGVTEAARAIGWKLRILDGQGSVSGRTAAMNQALALNPSGIILGGFDPTEQAAVIRKAAGLKVFVVGWHAGPKAGPDPSTGLFTNVSTDPLQVARVAADYAVVKSNGTAGVVVFTDSLYKVAVAKSTAMADVIRQCKGCALLAVEDTPLAETSARVPQLSTSLLQRFGTRWSYSLGINDLYFDFMGPALASTGEKPSGPPVNLSAGDGSESAYQRIRGNRYQAGTIPEPLLLHGWQLVDELNRAFSGAAPSGYSTPVHLVTPENIASDVGSNNVYDPANHYRDAYRRIWGK
ncbi:sugar ABC transporter substrate-binding protein (plasmid) [Paraburkholderia graminis]|uniref:ABC transporter substrate-binding protein n=1 Tax=Paraburkholderia graminis TaxID=60548 RepID=UPI000DF009CE|nr:substrate-binding domain-containing protein [Paraburkholderia graminis]AXF12941.1 sugar ABC transporter substrate-binding protein [Paraburkholderia graminis]